MRETEFTLEAGDGARVVVSRWEPEGAARAVVQIAHGASEHALRYRRIAADLARAGYAVYANDHRGHGRTAGGLEGFGVARPGGWEAILTDAHALSGRARADHPGAPLVLFGHSMGSMIARHYLQRWGGELAGIVLSGAVASIEGAQAIVAELGRAVETEGADVPSQVFAAMFAGFNEPWAGSAATGFEWLSRDAAEVKLYVDDPMCGAPLSNGFVLDMLAASASLEDPAQATRVPKGLPMLVFSGDRDPVGGANGEGVRELARHYERLGLAVTLKLYPDGRHEMLNETNRDEVHRDLLAWLDATLG